MLKKCFIFIGLLYGSIFICSNVKAESFYEGNYIPVYINKVKDGKIRYQQGRFLRRSSDNKFAYCLEPWAVISNGDVYEEESEITNLSNTQLTRISLIARYGYNYNNHTDDKWYYITQVLIWREIDHTSSFYFTNKLNGTKTDIYDNDMKEILDLVEKHHVVPKFEDHSIKLMLGEEKTIIDKNQVMDSFYLKSNSIVSKEGNNKLKIRGSQVGKFNFEFRKNDEQQFSYPLVYKSSSYQDILVSGKYESLLSNLEIEIIGGSIIIEKKGKPPHSGIDQSLSLLGSKFEIRNDSDEIVRTVSLDHKLSEKIDNLEKGTYTIREIEAGTGYKISNEIKTVTLSSNNMMSHIIFENEPIEKEIVINKFYGNDTLWMKEENITFEIFNEKSVLVKTVTTSKDGNISFLLPYGTYIVKQKNSKENYTKVDDWTIEVKDDKKEEFKLYDYEITGKITILKIDSKTHSPIEHAPTYFKIMNLTTGLWLDNTFKTDENGILEIEKLPFGKYKLIEVEPATNYLLSEEEYFFEIGSQNLDIYLEIENEQIVKVPNTNTSWKGDNKIELHSFPNYTFTNDWNNLWNIYLQERKNKRFILRFAKCK